MFNPHSLICQLFTTTGFVTYILDCPASAESLSHYVLFFNVKKNIFSFNHIQKLQLVIIIVVHCLINIVLVCPITGFVRNMLDHHTHVEITQPFSSTFRSGKFFLAYTLKSQKLSLIITIYCPKKRDCVPPMPFSFACPKKKIKELWQPKCHHCCCCCYPLFANPWLLTVTFFIPSQTLHDL